MPASTSSVSAFRLGNSTAAILLCVSAAASLLPFSSEVAWLLDHDRTHATNDFGIFFRTAECLLSRACDAYPMPLARFPNLNPPHLHLLLQPFVRFGIEGAFIGWLLLGACSVVITTLRLRQATAFPSTPGEIVLTVTFLVTSSITWTSIVTGQVYAVLAWPLYEAWFAARRREWNRAAIVLGVLATLKPFLVVPLAWVLWMRPRAAWPAVVSAAAVVAGGMIVFGWESYAGWIEHLQAIQPPGHPADGSIVSAATRVLTPTPWYEPLLNLPQAVTPLWIVLSLALAFDAMRWMPRVSIDRAWLGAMAAAFLISPRGWVYAGWLLLGPAAVVAMQSRWREPRLVLALSLLLLPGAVTSLWQPSQWLTPLAGSLYGWAWLLMYLGARRASTDAGPERE